MIFNFDNSYARTLKGCYTAWQPEPSPHPRLLYLNQELAEQLCLDLSGITPDALAQLFVGNQLPEGAQPIAQAYAGHQFGHFNPQLGDGRALLLGEVLDRTGQRVDIAFKGSGRTPFSRGGDGKAALGPMLREVLVGEAMRALGVPTTRSLAVAATGASVFREGEQPGAVLTRVAASHIRIGTFQFFAARGEQENVKRLADYSIARHQPELVGTEQPYPAFLRAVAVRQAALVAKWMSLGFIHGVMNTDNMSIAGETIDYGPCAFMEAYDPNAVFSSIDHQGRYSYQNQPRIAQWNLARFAETLLPLLAEEQEAAIELANAVLEEYNTELQQHWLKNMRAKLGIEKPAQDTEQDERLIESWLELLKSNQVDFTLAYRFLADAAEGQDERLRALFADGASLDAWMTAWRARTSSQTPQQQAAAMRAVNPWLIPRNHRVEEALAAANENDLVPFEALLAALQTPYHEAPETAKFAEPATAAFTATYVTYCGT